MLESFLSLSPSAILAICLIVPNLVAAPFVIAILKRSITTSEGDATMLGPTVGFVGTSFSLLLAFVMVTVWTDQTAGESVLFNELATIENILVVSHVAAPERSAALKNAATKYVELMRAREVDETAPIGGDPEAERAFESTARILIELQRSLAADPQRQAAAQSFFDQTREWTEEREQRVNKPSGQLDEIMTVVLIVLALFTIIAFALLPATTTAWAKWTQTVGVTMTIGLGMFLVFYISSESFTRTAEDQQLRRVQEALGGVPALDLVSEAPTLPTTGGSR
jgi:hypothetical protein